MYLLRFVCPIHLLWLVLFIGRSLWLYNRLEPRVPQTNTASSLPLLPTSCLQVWRRPRTSTRLLTGDSLLVISPIAAQPIAKLLKLYFYHDFGTQLLYPFNVFYTFKYGKLGRNIVLKALVSCLSKFLEIKVLRRLRSWVAMQGFTHVDNLGPIPGENGFNYCLTYVEEFSRHLQSYNFFI